MTFAAAALLGLTMGQPLGQDYHAMNSRNIKLPIKYEKDRRSIRQVTLYVARNGENTWYQEGFVTPDKDAFVYVAKDDGLYWFKMQIEDLKGNKDPADLTRDPPDLKMLIDTVKPVVRVTNAKRTGDEVVIEWAVDDKFPNDEATRVQFRATGAPDAPWQDVTLPPGPRNGVRFPSGTGDGVTVKIAVADMAGNRTEITHNIPTGTVNSTTALSSPSPSPAMAPAPTGNTGPAAIAPPATDLIPGGPAPLMPAAPVAPAPVAPGPLAAQPMAPAAPPAAPAPAFPNNPSLGAGSPAPVFNSAPPPGTGAQPPAFNSAPPFPSGPALAEGPRPLATVDPKAAPAVTGQGTATPAAAWTGSGPTVEVTRAQAINYPRFDLGFDLEQRGPSGINHVNLWVTRDEGRTWQYWSQHDGKGGAIRVSLDAKENRQLEGAYGFRLVPVSGAGLSEREPVAGDAPDMRVVLDVTPPQIDLFPPQSDPNALDTLLIQWKATDRNFGDDPITLEWSDSPTGPWKPVAGTGTDPVVQATALNAPVAKRLANTGQYSWRVPAGVPARVYLKATARDAAGNVKEVVTREPILVDLTKPRARINGIVPPTAPK